MAGLISFWPAYLLLGYRSSIVTNGVIPSVFLICSYRVAYREQTSKRVLVYICIYIYRCVCTYTVGGGLFIYARRINTGWNSKAHSGCFSLGGPKGRKHFLILYGTLFEPTIETRRWIYVLLQQSSEACGYSMGLNTVVYAGTYSQSSYSLTYLKHSAKSLVGVCIGPLSWIPLSGAQRGGRQILGSKHGAPNSPN